MSKPDMKRKEELDVFIEPYAELFKEASELVDGGAQWGLLPCQNSETGELLAVLALVRANPRAAQPGQQKLLIQPVARMLLREELRLLHPPPGITEVPKFDA
jgi:hypothetical protein